MRYMASIGFLVSMAVILLFIATMQGLPPMEPWRLASLYVALVLGSIIESVTLTFALCLLIDRVGR